MRSTPARMVAIPLIAAMVAASPAMAAAQSQTELLLPPDPHGNRWSMPKIAMPDMKMPEIPTPNVRMPEVEMPAISFSTAVGLGAIAGIVGFNLLALGPGALPGGIAYASGAIVPAEASVAMSRVYAVTSAVAGGLGADYLYSNVDQASRDAMTEKSPVNPRLLAIGTGAIAGITAFNLLSQPFGTVPFAGGTLAPVPTDIALGSRVVAGVSGGAGAIAAAKAHDAVTGDTHDNGQILTLAAGALGGIAAGNMISGWTGTLPLSAAATETAAASGVFSGAAAQAVSRIYVITAGVMGAWAADALYGVR